MRDNSPPKSTKLVYDQLTRRAFIASAACSSALISISPVALSKEEENLPPIEEASTQFFNADEWLTIIALCGVLIPSAGEGPGAIEARVPVFIDLQLAGDYGDASDWYMEGPHQADADPHFGYQTPLTPREIYREGLSTFNDWCITELSAPFKDLDSDAQLNAVSALIEQKIEFSANARDFPSMLLQNTKEGYFADPQYGGNYQMQAWVYIGFPGARASFLEWATPEKDNVPYPLGPVSIKGDRA